MTAREARVAGAGYMAGCFVATVACLLSIALENRARNQPTREVNHHAQ